MGRSRAPANTVRMTDGSSLSRLAAEASTDDRAWHLLVRQLRDDVEEELARHGLVGTLAEPARRGTWRALAMRIQVGALDDVRVWIRQRAALEAHLAMRRTGGSADRPEPSTDRRQRVVERRSGTERRAVRRGERDRRGSVLAPRSPDSLAFEILRHRRRTGRG